MFIFVSRFCARVHIYLGLVMGLFAQCHLGGHALLTHNVGYGTVIDSWLHHELILQTNVK